jgi:hypothetical protein
MIFILSQLIVGVSVIYRLLMFVTLTDMVAAFFQTPAS